MIVKITKGSRPGDIGAYLHGAGNANEHIYEGVSGGAVIGGNLGRDGDRDETRWAADLRAAIKTRPDIKNPVWHASLRSAPGDRTLTDGEWAAAGQEMAEAMGYRELPWVMVRHGADHVHVVVSRVHETGEQVWNPRHDYRAAQRAASSIEARYGLTAAPRRKAPGTRSATKGQEIAAHRADAVAVGERREEAAEVRRLLAPTRPTPAKGRPAPGAGKGAAETADRLRRAREQYQRREGPDMGR